MSAEIFFKRAVFGEIYSLKKILKKYLTKGEKSGKIGKLSVSGQAKRLHETPVKTPRKNLKKVLKRY